MIQTLNTETAERRQNNGGNARRSRHTFPPPPPPLPTTPTVYHPPSPPSLSSRAPLPEPPLAKSPLHSRHDSPNHHWQHSRRPRPGRAPHNDSLAGAAAAAEGEEALPKRRPPVPRLRARRGVRPLQRGGDRGAGPRQGPCRHRPQPRRPRGHLRAHRPAVRAGVEARHGRGRGRSGRRLPGPVGVLLFNHSDADFAVRPGDRVAQMVVERVATPEVAEVDDLEDTARGQGGFGSTGV